MKIRYRNFCNSTLSAWVVTSFTFATLMRMLLVTFPGKDVLNQLVENALRQLAAEFPACELMVFSYSELPGRLSFSRRRAKIRELAQWKPDVVVCADFDRPVPSLSGGHLLVRAPLAVLLTAPPASSRLARRLSKAKVVIADSDWLRNHLVSRFGLVERLFKLVPLSATYDHRLPDAGLTRERLTGGNEYFFNADAIGPDARWERLLQAFSRFKKWQRSGLQLVLAGPLEPGYHNIFIEKLEAYKYRQDVLWMDKLPEADKAALIAAAFAVICLVPSFSSKLYIIHAFRHGIPVVSLKHELQMLQEIGGEAILYANDDNETTSLSQQMINLYKNEDLYTSLVHKGRQAAASLDRLQILEQLHKALLAAANP